LEIGASKAEEASWRSLFNMYGGTVAESKTNGTLEE
jgi:hypothetical protein